MKTKGTFKNGQSRDTGTQGENDDKQTKNFCFVLDTRRVTYSVTMLIIEERKTLCKKEKIRSYLREPPTMGKQLVNFITCGCESNAPFCNLQSRARTHAVLVIGLYDMLGNPTT